MATVYVHVECECGVWHTVPVEVTHNLEESVSPSTVTDHR